MKTRRRSVALLILLVLAACRPGAAEYSESEAPKGLSLDRVTARVDLRFAPRSARLAAADAARLYRLVTAGAIGPADRVTVAAAGRPGLAAARTAAIAAELLRYGIVAGALPAAGRSSRSTARWSRCRPAPIGASRRPPISPMRGRAISAARPSAISAGWSPAQPIWRAEIRSGRRSARPPFRRCSATSPTGCSRRTRAGPDRSWCRQPRCRRPRPPTPIADPGREVHELGMTPPPAPADRTARLRACGDSRRRVS